MTKIFFQPSQKEILASNLWKFILQVNSTHGLELKNYPELYDWSISYPEKFWAEVWTFCHIISSSPWQNILVDKDKMPGARWFVGAKLNFAENLLRHRGDKLALVFRSENGLRKTLSYDQLYLQTAQLASAFKKAGVVAGDRIAAWIPNCPEAVIGILAATSLGAIWSSCSPDFGINGLVDRFAQIEPKLLLMSDGYFYNGKTYENFSKIKNIQEKIPSLEKIILIPFIQSEIKTEESLYTLYSDFLDRNASLINFEQLPFDHPLYILYSSGTTGLPKCIVHGAGGVLLQHQKELVLHTNVKPEDIIFYYTTCGWMMWNWYISALGTGATVILYDGSPFHPKPDSLFDLIDEEKITIFGTSAKYISSLEKKDLAPIQTHSLTSLKTILSTGSPLLPENFEFVYQKIKKDICLSSISGGTDIISCFALGNPILPVYSGELQCRGLGLKVEIFNENGESVREEKGELVCTAPFPVMPIYFWNDKNGEKYHHAYFEKFSGVWAHGDYAEITAHEGMIIYGRSDTLLKPGGVRIGTAEIYRQVEKIDEVLESIVVGQEWQNDIRIILFVKLRDSITLNDDLIIRIKKIIRENASPHHVPAKIIQVSDIPRTMNGKIAEVAVRDVIHNRQVKNVDALANPEALEFFRGIKELSG
jgi:acetoacetyl-CoA synthetase